MFLAREVQDTPSAIINLATNRWYVFEDTNLLEVSEELSRHPEIQAVGIVDRELKAVGVVVRRTIFDILGRPFGRDVMTREIVKHAASHPPMFYFDTNISSVNEAIDSLKGTSETSYFPLKAPNGEYLGLFNSQDLLLYLSGMNQAGISLARSVQDRISPSSAAVSGGAFEAACAASRVRSIGSEFHFCTRSEPDRLSLGVIDIEGNGIGPAIAAASLWGAVTAADRKNSLGSFVKDLNRTIVDGIGPVMRMPGLFIWAEIESEDVFVADMAHGLAYIFRDSQLLGTRTPEFNHPLGSSRDLLPTISKYRLEPGDIMIALSASVTKQSDNLGEIYGLQRIKQLCIRERGNTLAVLAETLIRDFTDFRKGKALADDAAFLLLRRN